jgi:hypothetical protein
MLQPCWTMPCKWCRHEDDFLPIQRIWHLTVGMHIGLRHAKAPAWPFLVYRISKSRLCPLLLVEGRVAIRVASTSL